MTYSKSQIKSASDLKIGMRVRGGKRNRVRIVDEIDGRWIVFYEERRLCRKSFMEWVRKNKGE
jgi:hypothetical protein